MRRFSYNYFIKPFINTHTSKPQNNGEQIILHSKNGEILVVLRQKFSNIYFKRSIMRTAFFATVVAFALTISVNSFAQTPKEQIKEGKAEVKQGAAEVKTAHKDAKAVKAEVKAGTVSKEDAKPKLQADKAQIKEGKKTVHAGKAQIHEGKKAIRAAKAPK